jgi:very-short-patch-repair endonuclease
MHRIHQGVYAIGHRLLSPDGRLMAAVLACGPGAVVSHRSAAALWGLSAGAGARIEVSTPPWRRGRWSPGLRVHQSRLLPDDDVGRVRGIPCTTVARTLVDYAGATDLRRLEAAVAQAEVLRLFDLNSLRATLRRNRGRRGVARLRKLVSQMDPEVVHTRSELERRFLALCSERLLPAPEVDVAVRAGGSLFMADFAWPDRRLIVETDGLRFHGTRSAIERDHRRDQLLIAAGWRVIRCTWRQVVHEPADLVRTLRELLASQPSGL